MIHTFRDIHNDNLYNDTRVMIVTGKYPIFNNIVIDKLREVSKGSIDDIDMSATNEIMSEFGESSADLSGAMSFDFDTFMDVAKSPTVDGKWFCSCDYSILTKKQREKLDRYLKSPSEFGCLVVNSLEWKDYRQFFKNRTLSGSKFSHLMKLSFPTRTELKDVVIDMFLQRDIKINSKVADYFIMRMSSSYNDYADVIDDITEKFKETNGGNVIDYDKAKLLLKNVENFVLDDFIFELVKPIKNKKVVKNRKVYKMIDSLASDIGFVKLISQLKYKIDDLIELRININNGNIPVMVRYDIKKVKNRLGEENKLNKLSDFAFKRYAYLASQTTLKDWYYMKLILNNISKSWSEVECEKALLALVHRNTNSNDRVLNDIGVKDTLKENLVHLNMTPYNMRFSGFDDNRYIDILK